MTKQSSEIRRRFGAPSEKPKAPQRGRTVASIRELEARKAHEDHAAAREIAELYDMPCDVGELL